MEAASVPGAGPAGAEAAQPAPGQPFEQQAAQPSPFEAQPGQPEQPAAPPQQGDIGAQLAAMEQRAKAAEQQLQDFQGQEPQHDLVSALLGEGEDAGLTAEELAAAQAGQEPGQMDPAQEDAQLAELDSYVKERIQEALNPLEEARQVEGAQAWLKEHPDVTPGSEMQKEVLATMVNVAERYGDQAALDPHMLDLAYTHVKAKLADAGATPAEAAANHGASIETQAAQTQMGEDSVGDQYRSALAGTGAGSLPFEQ